MFRCATLAITKNGIRRRYYYSVEHGGFRPAPERTQGTYSKYNSIDDKIDDFFYYTTYIKYGIGRTTYDAAQEIRNEEITLEEGKALCKKFDGEYPDRFEKEIFQYLSLDASTSRGPASCLNSPKMDREYFMHLADPFPAVPTFGNGRTTCGNCVTPPTRATARYCGATRGERTTKFE